MCGCLAKRESSVGLQKPRSTKQNAKYPTSRGGILDVSMRTMAFLSYRYRDVSLYTTHVYNEGLLNGHFLFTAPKES